MTLDEAIQHCEEVADEKEEDAILYHNCATYNQNLYEKGLAENTEKECRACAEEHRQLAEWLKELQAHREAWKKVEDRIKITKLGYANSDSIACMAEIRAFNRSLEIIEEYRPKEGDADETTK